MSRTLARDKRKKEGDRVKAKAGVDLGRNSGGTKTNLKGAELNFRSREERIEAVCRSREKLLLKKEGGKKKKA